MDDQAFDDLLTSIQDMGKHMRAEPVAVRVREFSDPDVKAIREKTGLSQTGFASLIGIKPKTLQNWEQKRVRPAGPARALLKIVEANPAMLMAIQS